MREDRGRAGGAWVRVLCRRVWGSGDWGGYGQRIGEKVLCEGGAGSVRGGEGAWRRVLCEGGAGRVRGGASAAQSGNGRRWGGQRAVQGEAGRPG